MNVRFHQKRSFRSGEMYRFDGPLSAKSGEWRIGLKFLNMTTKARVVEGRDLDEGRGLGDFHFESIPSPGDRVILPSVSGDLDIMEVLYVEHYPIKAIDENSSKEERVIFETEKPFLMIYVDFIGRDTGGH